MSEQLLISSAMTWYNAPIQDPIHQSCHTIGGRSIVRSVHGQPSFMLFQMHPTPGISPAMFYKKEIAKKKRKNI
jgi:hypothetical protein